MKILLEYLWYGVVLSLTIVFLQTKIYKIDFSWFNLIAFMILCPLAIWLTKWMLIEFTRLRDGD